MKHGGLAVYPIGSVMRQTSLTGRQIRYYEQMQLIDPTRSKGNQRLYSDADVERLIQIKRFLDDGYNIDGIRALMIGQSAPSPNPNATDIALPAPVHDTSAFDLASSYPDEHDDDLELESVLPDIHPQMLGASKLVSLYPVNNSARLQDLLLSKPHRGTED